MSLLATFFKPPRHKRFHYEPLYYNPEKEERENRNKHIRQELGLEEGGEYVSNIRGSFRKHHEANLKVRHRANVRFVIILAVLLFMAYMLIF